MRVGQWCVPPISWLLTCLVMRELMRVLRAPEEREKGTRARRRSGIEEASAQKKSENESTKKEATIKRASDIRRVSRAMPPPCSIANKSATKHRT